MPKGNTKFCWWTSKHNDHPGNIFGLRTNNFWPIMSAFETWPETIRSLEYFWCGFFTSRGGSKLMSILQKKQRWPTWLTRMYLKMGYTMFNMAISKKMANQSWDFEAFPLIWETTDTNRAAGVCRGKRLYDGRLALHLAARIGRPHGASLRTGASLQR